MTQSVSTKINSNISTVNPVLMNSYSRQSSHQSKQSSVSSVSNKAQSSSNYKFYKPVFTPSTTRVISKPYERRQYRFVSERLDESKASNRSIDVQTSKKQNNQAFSKRGESSYSYHDSSRIESPFRNTYGQPSYYTIKEQNSNFSIQSNGETNIYKAVQLKKINSFETMQMKNNPLMIESTIIVQNDQISKDISFPKYSQLNKCSSQQKIFSANNSPEKSKQAQLNRFYSNSRLCQKCTALQRTNKELQKRNFQLTQDAFSNQSLIKSHQLKCTQLTKSLQLANQKCRRTEESIKISRNIITALNQKMARIITENQSHLKSLEQDYHKKIISQEHSHQQTTKQQQSLIFELNLKIIDQTNLMDEAVHKAEKNLSQHFQKERAQFIIQLQALKSNASPNTSINFPTIIQQLESVIRNHQGQIMRLNGIIVNMQGDLMRLDQQNLRLYQQNCRIAQANTELHQVHAEVLSLRNQNGQMLQDIHQLNIVLNQSTEQNTNLKLDIDRRVEQFNQDLKFLDQGKKFLQFQLLQRHRISNQTINRMNEQLAFLNKELLDCKIHNEQLVRQKQQMAQQVRILQIQLFELHKKTQQQTSNISEQSKRLEIQLFEWKNRSNQLEVQMNQKIKILQSQIFGSHRQIQHLNNRIIEQLAKNDALMRENQQIIEEMEDKDGKIAQLNIWKSNTMLQMLELKQNVRKQKEKQQSMYNSHQRQKDFHEQWLVHEQKLKTVIQQKTNYIHQQESILQQLNKAHLSERYIIQSGYKQQLQFKEKHIIDLKNMIAQKSNQIQSIKIHFQSKLVQKEKDFNQLQQKMDETGANQSNHHINIQQKMKMQQIKQNSLQDQLKYLRNSFSELQTQIIILQREKIHIQNNANQRISSLQLQMRRLDDIIQQQKRVVQQLSNQLNVQEADYRTMVEDQIKKITMIYSQDSNLVKGIDSPLKSMQSIQQCSSSQIIANERQMTTPSTEQLQNFYNLTRQQLITKAQQLQFFNKSIQIRVDQINKMEQSLNNIIMNKIKIFQDNLQKNQQEKNQLYQLNTQLNKQIQTLKQKCTQYEVQIQWADNTYKELQSNLSFTIEELLKTHAQYMNFKLISKYSQITMSQEQIVQNNQNIIQEEILENNQQIFTYINKNGLLEDQQFYCQIQDKYIKQAKHDDHIYSIVVSKVSSEQDQDQGQDINQAQWNQIVQDIEQIQEWQNAYEQQFDQRMDKNSKMRQNGKEQIQERFMSPKLSPQKIIEEVQQIPNQSPKKQITADSPSNKQQQQTSLQNYHDELQIRQNQ